MCYRVLCKRSPLLNSGIYQSVFPVRRLRAPFQHCDSLSIPLIMPVSRMSQDVASRANNRDFVLQKPKDRDLPDPDILRDLPASQINQPNPMVRRPNYPVKGSELNHKVFGVPAPLANALFNGAKKVVFIGTGAVLMYMFSCSYEMSKDVEKALKICSEHEGFKQKVGVWKYANFSAFKDKFLRKVVDSDQSSLEASKKIVACEVIGTIGSGWIYFELNENKCDHYFRYIFVKLDNGLDEILVVADNRENPPELFSL